MARHNTQKGKKCCDSSSQRVRFPLFHDNCLNCGAAGLAFPQGEPVRTPGSPTRHTPSALMAPLPNLPCTDECVPGLHGSSAEAWYTTDHPPLTRHDEAFRARTGAVALNRGPTSPFDESSPSAPSLASLVLSSVWAPCVHVQEARARRPVAQGAPPPPPRPGRGERQHTAAV